jgi:putative endonuclease
VSRARGKHWEVVAERWLKSRGVRIIGRNFACRAGEIDLIARDGAEVAFVEVKYRSRSGFGSGADHVTRRKQRRIINAARMYLQYHEPAPSQVFRFDVISIGDGLGGARIRWIKSAFEAV